MLTTRQTLCVALWLALVACEPQKEQPAFSAPVTADELAGGACDLYAPVCGEDGLTYSSACEAEQAGAPIAFLAPCDCTLMMTSTATTSVVQGAWAATAAWRIAIEINGNAIQRIDYLDECGPTGGCPGSGIAVSYGTLNIKGNSPLVHVNWTQPTINPLVTLPPLYIFESNCADGEAYLVELDPVELFFGKQH